MFKTLFNAIAHLVKEERLPPICLKTRTNIKLMLARSAVGLEFVSIFSLMKSVFRIKIVIPANMKIEINEKIEDDPALFNILGKGREITPRDNVAAPRMAIAEILGSISTAAAEKNINEKRLAYSANENLRTLFLTGIKGATLFIWFLGLGGNNTNVA